MIISIEKIKSLSQSIFEKVVKIADATMDSVYHVAKELNLLIPDVESEVKE